MRKTQLAGAIALSLGVGTATAATYTLAVTQMVWDSISAVSGTATNANGVASGSFGGVHFYLPWNAYPLAVFDTVGSHSWTGSHPFQGTYNYSFDLTAGQVAFGLEFEWISGLPYPALAIFDCGQGTTGSVCTGTGGDGPNGGVPMQTNPFPGQDPAWNGYIAAGSLSQVPLPGAAWLFGAGLTTLVAVARRRSARTFSCINKAQ